MPNRSPRENLTARARLSSGASATGSDRGLHPGYLRLLLAVLEAEGCNAQALCDHCGLDRADLQGEQLLPLGPCVGLIETALARSGHPWLGLEVAAAAPVFSHGALAQAVAASASLREALMLIARYLPQRVPALQLSLQARPPGLLLGMVATTMLGLAQRPVIECALLMLERLLCGLSLGDFSSARIKLPWPEPPLAGQYTRYFRSTLCFGADACGLWIPDALADAPLLSADPQLLVVARARCEQQRQALGAEREVLAELRRRLAACDSQYPSAVQMAATLQMSPRSFQRLLSAEGLRWRGLVDAARAERALTLLRETRLSVEQIAPRLGYADASNFSRCLRRWYGCSASELRRDSGNAEEFSVAARHGGRARGSRPGGS
jgi:AraC-like DNA-binding protein